MIGDLVMADVRTEEGTKHFNVRIDGIDENHTLIDGSCYVSWCSLDKQKDEWEYSQDLNPITLTEDILKANGFEARGSNTFTRPFGKFFVVVELDYNDIEISKYYGIGTDDEECEYGSDIHFEENIKVHELQHVLRLCGLDELADNFKVE